MIGVLGMISCFSLSPSVKLYVLQRGLAGRQVVMINGSPLLLWNNVHQWMSEWNKLMAWGMKYALETRNPMGYILLFAGTKVELVGVAMMWPMITAPVSGLVLTDSLVRSLRNFVGGYKWGCYDLLMIETNSESMTSSKANSGLAMSSRSLVILWAMTSVAIVHSTNSEEVSINP